MAPEVAYEWYSQEFGGALDAKAFGACLPSALARVRARCAAHDLSCLEGGDLAAFRRAVCAAVEAIDDPAVSSWSAGKASETYVDASTAGIDAAIERELSGSRLASCWVRRG